MVFFLKWASSTSARNQRQLNRTSSYVTLVACPAHCTVVSCYTSYSGVNTSYRAVRGVDQVSTSYIWSDSRHRYQRLCSRRWEQERTEGCYKLAGCHFKVEKGEVRAVDCKNESNVTISQYKTVWRQQYTARNDTVLTTNTEILSRIFSRNRKKTH